MGSTTVHIGLIDTITGAMTYEVSALGSGFESAAAAACKGLEGEFEYNGTTYASSARPAAATTSTPPTTASPTSASSPAATTSGALS